MRKLRNLRRGSNWLQNRAGKLQAWDPNPENIPAQVPNTRLTQPLTSCELSLHPELLINSALRAVRKIE